MKKTVLAIAIAALVLPGAANAQADRNPNLGAYVSTTAHDSRADERESNVHDDNRGRSARDNNRGRSDPAKAHDFKRGERFDRSRATNYREIDYRQVRGLDAPPRGYHYVQSGDDVLLVAITSGIVGAVIGGLLT